MSSTRRVDRDPPCQAAGRIHRAFDATDVAAADQESTPQGISCPARVAETFQASTDRRVIPRLGFKSSTRDGSQLPWLALLRPQAMSLQVLSNGLLACRERPSWPWRHDPQSRNP
jgi:hypothetical protein